MKKKIMTKNEILDSQHWIYEDYKQRILSKHWRELLLDDADNIIFKGSFRKLKAKNLGYGVVEISKEK